LPKDPVQRAKARFFVEAVSSKYLPAVMGFSFRGEPYTKILEAIEALQALLPENGKWALGDDFSIADVSIAPFLARGEITFKNEFVANEGDGAKILNALQSPKYARFWKYFQDLKSRPSFVKTFDEV
jgi:glutathione S-transferase